jgi:hypothetical protein
MDSQISRASFLHVPPLDAFGSIVDYQEFIMPRVAWSVEAGRRDLLELFRSYASGPSGVMVAKGPDINLTRVEFLARCFPDAQFLLIFRDPVANVEGLCRKWRLFQECTLAETMRFYLEIHEHFVRAAEALPTQVLAVEYETLVEHPDATLDAIGARLALVPASRSHRLAAVPNVEGKGIRNVRRGRIQVVKDADQRAHGRLDSADAETIRTALGPLQERLRAAPFTIHMDPSR